MKMGDCVSEPDVAVLIPAYGRCDLTKAAVACALATGAGEIVVSEDASGEDMSAVEKIADSRLRFVRQPSNLGLWRNHLALLRLTDKRWIKFLQTDDGFTPDCLRIMCAAAGPGTTLISVLPVYRNLDTGTVDERYRLSEPLRWREGRYVDRMTEAGNEPGRPSYNLFRRDALIETVDAWRNDMSCDLVANVIAASRGEVVLLPPGPVVCGLHGRRDGATQSFELLVRRLSNSLAFLSVYPDARVRRFASIYGAVEMLGVVRTYFGRRRKGGRYAWPHPWADIRTMIRSLRLRHVFAHPGLVWRYWRSKYCRHKVIVVRGDGDRSGHRKLAPLGLSVLWSLGLPICR